MKNLKVKDDICIFSSYGQSTVYIFLVLLVSINEDLFRASVTVGEADDIISLKKAGSVNMSKIEKLGFNLTIFINVSLSSILSMFLSKILQYSNRP